MNKEKLINIFDKIRGASFYILAAAVTFSNSFTEITTAIIILLWLIQMALRKDYKLPAAGISVVLILFVVWNLLSFINTAYINESIRGLGKIVKHVLLFLAAVDYFTSHKKIERILLFSLGVGFISALNGIVQFTIGIDLIRQRAIDQLDYLHRISSSFVHPNDFGAYLIVVIAIFLSLLFSKGQTLKKRILLAVAIPPVAFCLAATGSRGAWLGFLAAFLYLALAKSKKLLVGVLILLLISPVFLPNSIKGRFSDFLTIGRQKGGTVWERIELWSGTLDMVRQHPFLGFGVNTYTKNFPKYKPKDYPDIRYTHNSYLQMASEVGIVGAGAFLIFLVMLIAYVSRAIRCSPAGLGRNLSTGLTAGITGFLVHCAVDTQFFSVTLSAFLFLYLGVAVAYGVITYEKNS